MAALFESPADWIAPGDDGGGFDFQGNPPPADERKVSLADTDHIFGTGGDSAWVWKTFTRGHNPIYMDPLRHMNGLSVSEAQMAGARKAMGHTHAFAGKIDLVRMTPRSSLSSTRYCLADPGNEYVIYQPKPGAAFTVQLRAGKYRFAWFDIAKGATTRTGEIDASDGSTGFKPDSAEEAVLHLQAMTAN